MISPLEIEIKTLNLNNKKLTKAIFNQIESFSCFNSNLDFIGDNYFGYIQDKSKRYLMWSSGERLRKTDLSIYQSLYTLPGYEQSLDEKFEWFLQKTLVEYVKIEYSRSIRLELNDGQVKKYNDLVKKSKDFLAEIMNHQLFI